MPGSRGPHPTVVPVEPNPARHAIARASGADAVPAPSGDIADRIRDIAPEGIDVVIMAIGRPEALTPYLGILAPGARVSVFAGFNSEATLRFVANDIHDNETSTRSSGPPPADSRTSSGSPR